MTDELIERSVLIARDRLPAWPEVQAEARERAGKIRIGQTLFLKEHGVRSEAEYKRMAKQAGLIMTHAHIGLDTWEETKSALLYLYDELSKRNLVLDRFGLCLDRVMAYPPEMRSGVLRETGPQLRSIEEWIEVGQVVPIQPHAGDFMIGFPASMVNTECALSAGITTIGNVSQYFAHGAPEWTDDAATAVETTKALAVLGCLRSKGVLVHSYLDDGFGALLNDYADVLGWALLERYLVEDLLGGKLAHCFGGVTINPMMRVAWVMIMRAIHGEDCLGSMWYGDTLSFTEDFDRNLGLNAEYLLWDIVAQLRCPTGHAVLPLPVTEALQIPNARDLLQVHVMARRVEESARRIAPQLDLSPAEEIARNLLPLGRQVFQRALAGLERAGVDIRNPLEMLFALKKLGPAHFERAYGAGASDESWLRGRRPAYLTDVFARTDAMAENVLESLAGLETRCNRRVLLAGMDVHEHGLFIIHKVLREKGLTPIMAGSELSAAAIAAAARDASAEAVIVSTYNGNALEAGKSLKQEMLRLGVQAHLYIGGRLNQGVENEALPVDATQGLLEMGLTPCRTIQELLTGLFASPNEDF